MSRYGRYNSGREWVKWQRGGEWVDNDEGYHYAYCSVEGKRTEHGISEGCISCMNKSLTQRR
jgi:hypothetical protein